MLRLVSDANKAQGAGERIDARDADMCRQLVLELPFPAVTKRDILAIIARDSAQVEVAKKGWFILIFPAQFAWVHDQLKLLKRNRGLALDIWAHLPRFIDMDTGRVTLSRADLADLHGCTVAQVGKVMSALVELGAIERKSAGRRVFYFLNPHVGTHVGSEAGRVVARDGWKEIPAARRDLFEVVPNGR